MDRRNFFRTASLSVAGLMAPKFAGAMQNSADKAYILPNPPVEANGMAGF